MWCVVDLRCCFVALSLALSLSGPSDLDLSCEESAVLDGVIFRSFWRGSFLNSIQLHEQYAEDS